MVRQPTKLQEKMNWYLTVVVLILSIILPLILCGLFYLSRVPDVTWGEENSPRYTRIWMHRERRPVGIGYESRRIIETFSDTEICVQNNLRFFLWGEARSAEPVETRQKMVLVNNLWQPTGEACR